MPVSINATLPAARKIATEPHGLYKGEISNIDGMAINSIHRTGGFWKPRIGTIGITEEAFDGEEKPTVITLPVEVQSVAYSTFTTIPATGQLEEVVDGIATYNLIIPDYDDVQTKGTLTANLIPFFTDITGAGRLNLTLNISKATAINTSITISSDRATIDVAHDVAESCNHSFYIEDDTLYLIDLLKNSGVSHSFDAGYDCLYGFPTHKAPELYSNFIGGAYNIVGDHSNGKEFKRSFLSHTGQTEIEAELTRAKTILGKEWIVSKLPLEKAGAVGYADEIVITDIDNNETLTFLARNFVYDMAEGIEVVTIEGEGTIT